MTTTASDRVQVVSQGELLHPGACALCGSGNSDEGYINMGIWYEYEGQQYYCMNCVRQIIAVVGGLTDDQAEHLNGLNEELVGRNTALRTELEEANELLGKWNGLINSIGVSDATLTAFGNAISVDASEADPTVNTEPKVSESKSVETESKPSKPVAGKRPPKSSGAATNDGQFDL